MVDSLQSLINAVQLGNSQLVVESINAGISANTKDIEDCSLLHWAAINNRIEVLDVLLKNGANVNIIGGLNREIALQWAVRRGDSGKVVSILVTNKSDLTIKSIQGYDSLFLAVISGHVHIAFLLLHSGADPNTRDLQGNSPLHYLLQQPNPSTSIDMIRLLLRFGGDCTAENDAGETPLHILATNGTGKDFELAFSICSEVYRPLLTITNHAHKCLLQVSI
jgi:palmitoyltransferase ZDHHC13/17